MSLTFKVPNIQINLDPIKNEILQEIYNILNLINKEIAQNRGKGINSVGAAYREYSPSYKKAIDAGYVKFKGKSSPSTLIQTGQFNRSFNVAKIPNGAGIKIDSQRNRDLLNWLQEMGFNDIMTLSPENQKRVEEAVNKVINKNLSKLIIIQK